MTCQICSIIQGKEKAKKIYEDQLVYVVLLEKGAALGHVRVFPKEHYETLEDTPDNVVSHLFFVASFSASSVFEGLGAQGTNIIICNGKNADQKYPHVYVDVVPRKEDDDLTFQWVPKELNEDEIKSSQEQISDKTFYIGKEEAAPETKGEKKVLQPAKKETKKVKSEEEDYMIKQHFEKIP